MTLMDGLYFLNVLLTYSTVAHPNVPEVFIRLQTDGTITPKDALLEVCKQLVLAFGQLGRDFTREYELRRVVAAGNQDQANGGGNGA
jgi:DNA-directed RNA polymerase II subunit RPB11